jgi:DNA-binding CsgD family transcriptional regulator
MESEGAEELGKLLGELQQLERELVEQAHLRRSDGVERVGEALRRLGEVGSPGGVIERCADEFGRSSDFDRVLVSRIDATGLRPVAVWSSDDRPEVQGALGALASRTVPLQYPLVEAEVAQRQDAVIVSVSESGSRALPDLAQALQWDVYAVAAILLEGNTVGLLHADRISGAPPLDDIDLELVRSYADGVGQVFERATLRQQLHRQRRQLQAAARWMNGQMLRLSEETPSSAPDVARHGSELAELLTRRELEVVKLIARGQSNRAIATTLMLGEGTVKYHVKNILRKLQARSRTEAVSRYMRQYSAVDQP